VGQAELIRSHFPGRKKRVKKWARGFQPQYGREKENRLGEKYFQEKESSLDGEKTNDQKLQLLYQKKVGRNALLRKVRPKIPSWETFT